MNNLSSYCGLVDAKIRAADKDLPVPLTILKALLHIMTFVPHNRWIDHANNMKEMPGQPANSKCSHNYSHHFNKLFLVFQNPFIPSIICISRGLIGPKSDPHSNIGISQ